VIAVETALFLFSPRAAPERFGLARPGTARICAEGYKFV
jgi:hypothetical protein